MVTLSPADALSGVCRLAPQIERADYAVDGLVPQAVALPRTVDELASVVRLAAEQRWAVIPRGGGTQMSLGNIPLGADVVVCTSELNQVLEYEPADLVVTVQAGMRLADLQRILAERGQFLPLDPPLPERATVGGIIAANASGPLRLRHGTVRDQLIGVKVVGADGSVSKGGGKVVKNVTGYDMCKLYTGSLGTLGVIVEASFKLAPVPPLDATVQATFKELIPAFEAARAIYRSGLPVRACELLAEGGEYRLATWLGGGRASVERQQRDVGAMCAAAATVETVEEAPAFWRRMEDFGRDGSHSITRLSVLPSRTGELLAQLPPGSVWLSRALSGVTYVLDHQLPAVLGGYAVLEACSLETKRRIDVWGPPGSDFKLMERIKHEFDPNGILNPGRYVGRL